MPIRKSVFETNSSSTHSISLGSGDFKINDKSFYSGVLNIYPGEFGWEVEEHNDIWTKASYALTWARANGVIYATMLREVIEKVTKCRVGFVPIAPNDWGYIDHQSEGIGAQVFKNKKTLTNFIFNSESVLYTDNDNHD